MDILIHIRFTIAVPCHGYSVESQMGITHGSNIVRPWTAHLSKQAKGQTHHFILFPQPKEALKEIWLHLAQWGTGAVDI